MEDLNDLFDDIRLWNRQWRVFESYIYSSIKTPDEIIPDMPKTSDAFISELNEKYIVNKRLK